MYTVGIHPVGSIVKRLRILGDDFGTHALLGKIQRDPRTGRQVQEGRFLQPTSQVGHFEPNGYFKMPPDEIYAATEAHMVLPPDSKEFQKMWVA